jgi:peptidoglycan/LPS O-acetylase OafA/YrhL
LRRDIQFLRGIAVLVVVLYHSNLGIISQGYLGVDVFFVLSGFLITGIILKTLENNTFYFSEFYLRRAKRLLPALYSTLIFTTLLSLVVLTSNQWFEYLAQLKGALTFTANMVLPGQSGYFESASEGKPLLHIWSLSLEEQYYFLLPITLYFLPKSYRLFGLVTLTIISLLWCFSWVYSENQTAPFLWRLADSSKSEWAFFLLFTRAWELLAGSLCAWLMLNQKGNINIPKPVKYIALFLIFFSCLVNINNEHPSIESVIVVLSTMVILLGNKDWLPRFIVIRFIEKIGDWSYSIYLVHWPLFAFAYLSYVGDVPTTIKITITLFSILLGYLQFKYVEIPFRVGKFKDIFSSWRVTITITMLFLTVPITYSYIAESNEDEFSHIRRINHGLTRDCEGSFDKNNQLKTACVQGKSPKIAVWGDSYAMHLVPGLSVKNKQFTQLTKSACGPIIGLAPMTKKHDSVWAQECLTFNNNAFAYIKSNKNITHVVLSGNFRNYLQFDGENYLTENGVIKSDYQLFINAFKHTISELKKLNIVPIIFSPLPKTGFNIGECLERDFGTALLLREDCTINYNESMHYQQHVNAALEEMEGVAKVIWLKNYLCDSNICKVKINDTLIYRDVGHLTVDASVELLKNIDIIEL